ncbi:MAG: methyltransferase domain-containing protein [Candidatus Saccharibacteria bacterium]|nr:methyltransferase domain-containing protein [Candidatus Saccharibacteria bacterium]
MESTLANAKKNTLSEPPTHNKYSVNGYRVDINNDADSHSILAKNALGSKRILDVGCGVGYIGRAIKENQNCIIHGIDIDSTALKYAKKYYDKTILMELGNKHNDAYLSFLKDRTTYDCIICGDIIEHLVDPGCIISVLAKKLSSGGKILISIPNIAYIDIIINLIDERFNYANTGILDNTHLRFWTESSFYEFIENVNNHYHTTLSPKLISKTSVHPSDLDTSYFQQVCGDEIFTFQNIFQVKKKDKPNVPHPHKKTNYHKIITSINTKDQIIANLEAQLAIKDKIIHDMELSLSWKITKPLRQANAAFRKHKK